MKSHNCLINSGIQKFVFAIILIFAITFDSFSQEMENYMEMSLEELLNIKVVSTTKSSISLQKAPGIIRVFTKDDFDKYGATTLLEVLNNIPGIQMQEYRAGHQLVWIRGVQQRYNNKVLLLIDGVPMRDSYYGNFNVDEMLPLDMVEKIEIINGPGSVLYGANSFSGVINITTKSKGKSVSASVGSFSSFTGVRGI